MKRKILLTFLLVLALVLAASAVSASDVNVTDSYTTNLVDDTSDDIILDSRLYFIFVRLAVRARELDDRDACRRIIEEELAEYTEPVPGAKERVEQVLRIMLTAWASAQLMAATQKMLGELAEGC